MTLVSTGRQIAIVLTVFVLALVQAMVAATAKPVAATPRAVALGGPQWGVYAGPGPKGVAGASTFVSRTRVPVTHVLDFLPGDSWAKMTSADWLINAHRRSPHMLELSVPMLPRQKGVSLARCAAGKYDRHWRVIATKLRRAGLGDTIIRPGWEFNGDWYAWSAKGREANYVGCFRRVVTVMRAVSRQFRFNWSVNNGSNPLDATRVWPGARYVDLIGVDVYDYDRRWYPTPVGTTRTNARTEVVNWAVNGTRGLVFWSAYARRQGKPLALSEWGMAWRSDGHAGGDNLVFLDAILDFVADPAHRVSYATYFNANVSAHLKHDLLGPHTAFPRAARRLTERVGR
jgi:hypothetical protein